MGTPRRAYDDASSATQMASDCEAVEATMQFPAPRRVDVVDVVDIVDVVDVVAAAPALAPPRQRAAAPPQLQVSDEAARLARSLHLPSD